MAFIERCHACKNHITFHNSKPWLQVVEKKKSLHILIKENNTGGFSHILWQICWLGICDSREDSAVWRAACNRQVFSLPPHPKQALTLNSACRAICVTNAHNVSQSNLLVVKPWAVKFLSAVVISVVMILQREMITEQHKASLTILDCTLCLP